MPPQGTNFAFVANPPAWGAITCKGVLDIVRHVYGIIIDATKVFFTYAAAGICAAILMPFRFWLRFWPQRVASFVVLALFVANTLDMTCPQPAVSSTSKMLSSVIQVDLCNVILDDRRELNGFSGLAALREGEAILRTVKILLDVSENAISSTNAAQKIGQTAERMASELEGQAVMSQSADIASLMRSAHSSLDELRSKCSSFEHHVERVVRSGAPDFVRIVGLVEELRSVGRQSAWRRVLHDWSRNHTPIKWFRGQSARLALAEVLNPSSPSLIQDLEDIHDEGIRVATDLRQVFLALDDISLHLWDEELASSAHCDSLRRESSGYLESTIVAWMTPWTAWNKSQSESACVQGKLPKRCCMTPPSYFNSVEIFTQAITTLAREISARGREVVQQQQELRHLRNMTEESIRLTFA